MIANVISYVGDRDGIRYGDVKFSDGSQRHFLFDRPGHRVRLYTRDGWDDDKPTRLSAALEALKDKP